MNKKLEEISKKLRLEWAEKAYKLRFDNNHQMSKDEKQKMKEQIPTLGIVPWDAAFSAAVKELRPAIEALKEIGENQPIDEDGMQGWVFGARRCARKALKKIGELDET